MAIVERFFPTLKNEFTRRVLVSARAWAFRQQPRDFLEWYNDYRPHGGLDGKTPTEAYEERTEGERTTAVNVLCISSYKGKRHLPLVTTRKGAA